MSKPLKSNLDVGQNQLISPVIENAESAPAISAPTPVEGQFYFDTTTKLPYYWNGTTWVPLASLNGNGNFDYIDFTLVPSPPVANSEGRIYWDDEHKTLSVGTEQNDVSLQLGQENFVRVVNKTGSTITNGQIVYINGAQGNRPTITLAKADSESTSSKTLGMATHDIPDNTNGYVTTFGTVRDLNTNTLSEGDTIWLSPTVSGGYQTTKPVSPEHSVFIGYVTRSDPTLGEIFVSVQNGYETIEIHDVSDSAPTITGQALIWNNSNSLYEPTYIVQSLEHKSGFVTAASFTGTPARTSSVTFTNAFPDANYSISVIGSDSRSWSYLSKTASGFTISSNAGQALTGDVLWTAIAHGEGS